MKIIRSLSTDPVRNFALERELLTEQDGDFLLLYINSQCVVVGRNQHPEAEADLDYCARENIPVLRRISGGGAVWHDEGNINFAFITNVGDGSPLDDSPLPAVIAALRETGVDVVAGDRRELLSNGEKISGTASCVKGGRQLFHGTLLFDADLGRMNRALAGDTGKRERRVASIPSPTANLRPMLARPCTATEFMDALAARFATILQDC